jgi:hypothetical protein
MFAAQADDATSVRMLSAMTFLRARRQSRGQLDVGGV